MQNEYKHIRNETEWIETIDLGVNILISQKDRIKIPGVESNLKNPYGDGGASTKIVKVLKKMKIKNLINKKFYDI